MKHMKNFLSSKRLDGLKLFRRITKKAGKQDRRNLDQLTKQQVCFSFVLRLGQVSTQFPVLPSDEEVFTSLRHYSASSYILKVNSVCFFVNIIQWHHASAT